MKPLYGARCIRYDLLWTICSLARCVTKWDKACDRRLHKFMCCIKCTLDTSLAAFAGNTAKELTVAVYSGADVASGFDSSQSTPGCYIALVGSYTFKPFCAISETQGCVSHSSTESEMVALEFAISSEASPTLTFWQYVVDVFHRGTKSPMKDSVRQQRKAQANATAIFIPDLVQHGGCDKYPPDFPDQQDRGLGTFTALRNPSVPTYHYSAITLYKNVQKWNMSIRWVNTREGLNQLSEIRTHT